MGGRRMLVCLVLAAAYLAGAQQQAASDKEKHGDQSSHASTSTVQQVLESKVQSEWEALKAKNTKAFGNLLADDFQGVETDNRGERTKVQAINELSNGYLYDYTIFPVRVMPLCGVAAAVIYEVTLEFPPKSQVRFSRVYITEIWTKHEGEWKLRHYQETHVK